MKKRNALSVVVATTASALVLAGCATSAPEAEVEDQATELSYEGVELVVTSFGGDWEAALIKGVVEPFEAETGANVTLVTAYSADALAQLTAQAGNPQFDVVHFSGGQELVAAEDGLIVPIAPEALSSYADLQPLAVEGMESGYGPVIQLTPVGLVYNSEKIADAPTSWTDVLDPAYAGHVALTDFSNTYGVLSMLRVNDALGSTIDDVTPGLSALGDLAASGDAIVVASSADLQTAFAQRDIWLAPYAQDYAETLRQAGLPVEFVIPEEGITASFITANVVAGRENAELAELFIDFSLRPEAQQVFAEMMRYTPVNTAVELSAEASAAVLSADDFGAIVRYDSEAIAAQRQAWTDDWNARISQ